MGKHFSLCTEPKNACNLMTGKKLLVISKIFSRKENYKLHTAQFLQSGAKWTSFLPTRMSFGQLIW